MEGQNHDCMLIRLYNISVLIGCGGDLQLMRFKCAEGCVEVFFENIELFYLFWMEVND